MTNTTTDSTIRATLLARGFFPVSGRPDDEAGELQRRYPCGARLIVTGPGGGDAPTADYWTIQASDKTGMASVEGGAACERVRDGVPSLVEALDSLEARLGGAATPTLAIEPPAIPAEVWGGVGAYLVQLHASVSGLLALYGEVDALNAAQPASLARCYAASLDDWACDIAAAREDVAALEAAARVRADPCIALDGLDNSLAWLIEMGMEPEVGGGGSISLRHEGPNGAHVLVTQFEGGGLPRPDSWHVGAYLAHDPSEAVWQESHARGEGYTRRDVSQLTLRQAVAAACGIVANDDTIFDASYDAAGIAHEVAISLDGDIAGARGVLSDAEANGCRVFVTASTGQRFVVTVEAREA
jgi:hypothetical protein